MSTEKEYATYSVHRNSKVAQFWANKRGGDYLGYKDGEDFTFSLERAGETHVGIDKGAYVVGYEKEEEFEIYKADMW
tara:strand:- start:8543 stop:8773 length:231 start_codon:yes stop_codon:yes gene_type:complete